MRERDIISFIYAKQYGLELRDDDQLYTKEGEAVGKHEGFKYRNNELSIKFKPYKALEYVQVTATVEMPKETT